MPGRRTIKFVRVIRNHSRVGSDSSPVEKGGGDRCPTNSCCLLATAGTAGLSLPDGPTSRIRPSFHGHQKMLRRRILMRAFKAISVLMLLALILSACGGSAPAATSAPAAPAASSAPAAPAATSAPAAAAGGDLKIAILAPLSGSQPTFG